MFVFEGVNDVSPTHHVGTSGATILTESNENKNEDSGDKVADSSPLIVHCLPTPTSSSNTPKSTDELLLPTTTAIALSNNKLTTTATSTGNVGNICNSALITPKSPKSNIKKSRYQQQHQQQTTDDLVIK